MVATAKVLVVVSGSGGDVDGAAAAVVGVETMLALQLPWRRYLRDSSQRLAGEGRGPQVLHPAVMQTELLLQINSFFVSRFFVVVAK